MYPAFSFPSKQEKFANQKFKICWKSAAKTRNFSQKKEKSLYVTGSYRQHSASTYLFVYYYYDKIDFERADMLNFDIFGAFDHQIDFIIVKKKDCSE